MHNCGGDFRRGGIMPNIVTNDAPLEHGGQLNKIAKQYAIPVEQWLDLSTGIAPFSYPIPAIPNNVWQRLPEASTALQQAASHYYHTDNLLPVAGSQVIIQLLPKIAKQQGYAGSWVWLSEVGYREHYKSWQTASYQINTYQDIEQLGELNLHDIVILINPNNPTGRLYSYQRVELLFSQIQKKKGLLIIDEAFMDCTPQHSFISQTSSPQLIVLRSIGKFFGLAGLRLGFVAASRIWIDIFKTQLGPWSINGPAQYIAQQALTDEIWQSKQHQQLKTHSTQLSKLLHQTFKQIPTGSLLFQTVKCDRAALIFEQLCQQAIYVRLCDERNALRFGIPTLHELPRLQLALSKVHY